MDAIHDRVINVPVSDTNIAKRATTLPRNDTNCGLVTVRLKRKLGLKNYHKFGMINPDRVYKALLYLTQNHDKYKDIKIEPYDEWVKKCSFINENNDTDDTVLDPELSDEENVDKEKDQGVKVNEDKENGTEEDPGDKSSKKPKRKKKLLAM